MLRDGFLSRLRNRQRQQFRQFRCLCLQKQPLKEQLHCPRNGIFLRKTVGLITLMFPQVCSSQLSTTYRICTALKHKSQRCKWQFTATYLDDSTLTATKMLTRATRPQTHTTDQSTKDFDRHRQLINSRYTI